MQTNREGFSVSVRNLSAWPPRPLFIFHNARGKIYFSSEDRKLDLADSLMLSSATKSRTVYLQFSTKAKGWDYWTDENVKAIEDRIRYDLGFDGYRVKIEPRHFILPDESPCSESLCWKLTIRSAW